MALVICFGCDKAYPENSPTCDHCLMSTRRQLITQPGIPWSLRFQVMFRLYPEIVTGVPVFIILAALWGIGVACVGQLLKGD
jgi:hypothetical protein